jgi:hypothetical protein
MLVQTMMQAMMQTTMLMQVMMQIMGDCGVCDTNCLPIDYNPCIKIWTKLGQ